MLLGGAPGRHGWLGGQQKADPTVLEARGQDLLLPAPLQALVLLAGCTRQPAEAHLQGVFPRSVLIPVSLSLQGHADLGPGTPPRHWPRLQQACFQSRSRPELRAGLGAGQTARQVVMSPGPWPPALPHAAPTEGREAPGPGPASQRAPCGDEGGWVVPG